MLSDSHAEVGLLKWQQLVHQLEGVPMDCADDLTAVTDDVAMTADGDDGEMICIVAHDGHCQGFH